jgi:hypothetical protein
MNMSATHPISFSPYFLWRVCGLFWRLASTEICWLQHHCNTLRFLVELSEAAVRQMFPQSSRLRYQKNSEQVLFAQLLSWA